MGQAANSHGRQIDDGTWPSTGTSTTTSVSVYRIPSFLRPSPLRPGEVLMKVKLWAIVVGIVLGSVSVVAASDGVAPLEMGAQASPGEIVPVAEVSSAKNGENALPKTAMITSEKLIKKLRAGFLVALERVQAIPQCAGLFSELDADGVEMMTTTLYTVTHPLDEQSICQTAAAFTWVGGVHTRVCRRFSSLSVERAAMTLLHEALHHAGLTEQPMDPQGMTAREIDGMVSDACGRKSLKRELSARMER